jgi:hypothetical protein
LTIVAAQLIIAGALPIADNVSWLGKLALFCIIFITCVCIETCMAAYMMHKKGLPAKWVRIIILISLPLKFFSFICGVNPADDDDDDNETFLLSSKHQASSENNNKDLEMQKTSDSSTADIKIEKLIRPSVSMLVGQSPSNALQPTTKILSSWRRGSVSLDRISRVLFPIVFTISIISFFVDNKNVNQV